MTILYHLIHVIIQHNFQACLRVEECLQEASQSSYIYLTWYYFLTCTDAKRDLQKPIMAEPNKDDMSIERRNVGKRSTATQNGMYKLAF